MEIQNQTLLCYCDGGDTDPPYELYKMEVNLLEITHYLLIAFVLFVILFYTSLIIYNKVRY